MRRSKRSAGQGGRVGIGLTPCLGALWLSLVFAPAASWAAAPEPFAGDLVKGDASGLTCDPVGEPAVARFCLSAPSGTRGEDMRVASFDGQPIEADVTLPTAGDGPWPLIFMVHGYAGNKRESETDDPASTGADNVGLAKRGYAVVNISTRGFGGSCGSAIGYTAAGDDVEAWAGSLRDPPRGSGVCQDRWVHLADARYEARDIQTLAGFLVDDGIAVPDRIGVVGASYGGGHGLILARLKDRVMLRDGTTTEWRSPRGTPLQIGAVAALVPWSDLRNALLPNGRLLDTNILSRDTAIAGKPIGVKKDDWTSTLYLGGYATGTYADRATPGCLLPILDPSYPDLSCWFKHIDDGEPYDVEGSSLPTIADEILRHHSAIGVWDAPGIDGPPAPSFIVSGWTDDLFPPIEGLTFHRRALDDGGKSFFGIADVGHMRAQNKDDAEAALEARANAWLDHFLKDEDPEPESGVGAWTMTCPAEAPSGGPYIASRWEDLARGQIAYGSSEPQAVDAGGGRQDLSLATDPNPAFGYIPGIPPEYAERVVDYRPDACRKTSPWQEPGVASYVLPPVTAPYTLLGMPTIEARIRTRGAGGDSPVTSDGELAARLWDVDPTGAQTLVTKGVYRLDGNETGAIAFQLNGNAWRFEKDHRPKLEILGRDDYYDTEREDPGDANVLIGSYRRSNNLDFTVEVDSARLTLPTAEEDPGNDGDEPGGGEPGTETPSSLAHEPVTGEPAAGGGAAGTAKAKRKKAGKKCRPPARAKKRRCKASRRCKRRRAAERKKRQAAKRCKRARSGHAKEAESVASREWGNPRGGGTGLANALAGADGR